MKLESDKLPKLDICGLEQSEPKLTRKTRNEQRLDSRMGLPYYEHMTMVERKLGCPMFQNVLHDLSR